MRRGLHRATCTIDRVQRNGEFSSFVFIALAEQRQPLQDPHGHLFWLSLPVPLSFTALGEVGELAAVEQLPHFHVHPFLFRSMRLLGRHHRPHGNGALFISIGGKAAIGQRWRCQLRIKNLHFNELSHLITERKQHPAIACDIRIQMTFSVVFQPEGCFRSLF